MAASLLLIAVFAMTAIPHAAGENPAQYYTKSEFREMLPDYDDIDVSHISVYTGPATSTNQEVATAWYNLYLGNIKPGAWWEYTSFSEVFFNEPSCFGVKNTVISSCPGCYTLVYTYIEQGSETYEEVENSNMFIIVQWAESSMAPYLVHTYDIVMINPESTGFQTGDGNIPRTVGDTAVLDLGDPVEKGLLEDPYMIFYGMLAIGTLEWMAVLYRIGKGRPVIYKRK